MSEIKNTQDNETQSGSSADFSEHFNNEDIEYETIRFLIIAHKINPFDQKAVTELLNTFEGKFDVDIMLQAVKDAQTKAARDAINTQKLPTSTIYDVHKQVAEMMSERKDTKDNESDLVTFDDKDGEPEQTIYQFKQFKAKEDNPIIAFDNSVLKGIFMNLRGAFDENAILKALHDARNDFVHGKSSNKAVNDFWSKLVNERYNLRFAFVPLLIDTKNLTPHTLALVCTALTELTTKLWLVAQHRFADLIEYTQTRDVRFANEAGSTITYNSPFSFGLQLDRLVPGFSESVMTIVDGLSQRKAKAEKLQIDNQAAAQKIKEAEEALKQQQDLVQLDREKLRLENQKEQQTVAEQRLESRRKQFEYTIEFAGKAVDIVYPNADPEMRPIIIQTIVNNILQLDSVEGLRLTISGTGIQKYLQSENATASVTKDNPEAKENAG